MRLVNIDPLIQEGWVLERHGVSNTLLAVKSLADVPTIEAEPVRHGMTHERLLLSIQTVKENIVILEDVEPEDAGCYLQLEHERHILELLEAEAEGRLFVLPRKMDLEGELGNMMPGTALEWLKQPAKIELQDVVDLYKQTRDNNAAMRKVMDFITGGV